MLVDCCNFFEQRCFYIVFFYSYTCTLTVLLTLISIFKIKQKLKTFQTENHSVLTSCILAGKAIKSEILE